jgi:flagellar hook-associated protein 2
MSGLSSPGIGSGLDIRGIVSQLVQLEARPIQQIQQRASGLQARLSAFGQLQSQLNNLLEQLSRLTSASNWDAVRVTSSNPAAVSGSAAPDAVLTSFSVEVSQLARAQSAGSGSFTSGTAIGEGDLIIDIGLWSGTDFSSSRSSPPITITPTDSIREVATKINAAEAGVSAVVISDAAGERLLVRSTATGEANGFRIRAVDSGTAIPIAGNTGLDRIGFDYDPVSGSFTGLIRGPDQLARNTEATINGVAVTSNNNMLSDVITGVSLNLNQLTTTAINITVGRDNSNTRSAIEAFVTSYNSINAALQEMTRADPTRRNVGTLQGDSTATNLLQTLRRFVTGTGPSGQDLSRLSDIGLELQTDGSLLVNNTRLNTALENREQVRQLFAAPSTGPGSGGIATQLSNFINGMVGADGVLSSRTRSIQSTLSRNEREIERLNERLGRTEERLLAQYSRLDANLARLSALNTYVTQQLTALNRSQDRR